MKYRRRKQRGSLIDLAPTLWFLLMCITFPLLDLGTVGLRYTFLLGAARDAAQAASVSKTFLTDLSTSDVSVVNAAQTRAALNCSKFKGVTLINVRTNLLITDVSTGAVSRQSTPLVIPADTTTTLYQIEVIVTGDVDPLLTYTGKIAGNVPGLTGPARFVITSQQVCECPDGMNQ